MKYTLFALALILAACSGSSESGYDNAPTKPDAVAVVQHTDTYGDQLGTVQFSVSCTESARPHMERGLALLHHMTYPDAKRAFIAATEADPDCALGYWGEAMTFIHPLWPDAPDEAALQRGLELIETAKSRGTKTDLENAYIAALEAYYTDGTNRDEKSRLASFEQAWAKVHQKYPDDQEGKSFYALAHMATADPGDKTYTKQQRAGALAETVLTQIPDHPGAHHYVIHAYDLPSLADRALAVARNYGKIAPAVPHALHMPTHIFTRLGLWEESIAWNIRSREAALSHPVNGALSMHYLHAIDYLAYSYLQTAQDEKAREVLAEMKALEGPLQVHAGAAYTLAAVPARIALERQDWEAAAALEPRTPSFFAWDNFAAFESITHFARALGGARSGDFATARDALKTLDAYHAKVASANAYWAKQVDIQRTAARAWLTFEEGKRGEALGLMRKAAALEASTEKHPITPGEVLPAHELLGDMLLELKQPKDALTAYEASLARSPNRFNSLYGAGQAADKAGKRTQATQYYQQLAKVTAKADTEHARLQQATAFLAAN